MTQIDDFEADCAALRRAVEGGDNGERDSTGERDGRVQELFLRVRLGYKRFEWAAEYFEPAASRIVNGPPVPEVELSGQVFEPSGLQVIEGWLFPRYDSSRKKDLLKQLQWIAAACGKYKTRWANIDILDWQVFDATKLEVFRIMTLGITGFDDPLTLKSMAESAAGLEGVKAVFACYPDERLTGRVDSAIRYLTINTDFNTFNRAEFITKYCNPLTIDISGLESTLKIAVIRYNRLLNQDAKTLFDTGAFNIDAYSPGPAAFSTPAKVILGQKLFADPSLSLTGTRSCQSCHQPDKAFTDGLVKNTVLTGKGMLPRNTPTLINAALQPAQFYDMRVPTLEDQAVAVIQNNAEMHGDMKLSVQRLWRDTTYRRLFSAAFPHEGRTAIDTFEVMNAIGCYVRSLVSLNSRFDEYMRGNAAAMSEAEIDGFNSFMGKARCATCHYMPLFNGTFPPRWIKSEAEVIGVPEDPAGRRIDPDMGRYDVIKVESFRHAFKTPTVRNVARTGPYMHNGVFTSLEQVVDFYNKGGGAGLGLKIDNQTLPFDKLDLTEKERADLVAFMKCLDSK